MTSNEFRYHRDDFGPLPVALQHLDIVLNFINGVVRAASVMHLVARETLEELRLDARDIDVFRGNLQIHPLRFARNRLRYLLDSPIFLLCWRIAPC